MTAKELIEKLSELSPDAEVMIVGGGPDGEPYELSTVEYVDESSWALLS